MAGINLVSGEKEVIRVVDHPTRQVYLRTNDETAYAAYRHGFAPGALERLKAAGEIANVKFECNTAVQDVYGGRDGQVQTLALGEEEIYRNPDFAEPLQGEMEK